MIFFPVNIKIEIGNPDELKLHSPERSGGGHKGDTQGPPVRFHRAGQRDPLCTLTLTGFCRM